MRPHRLRKISDFLGFGIIGRLQCSNITNGGGNAVTLGGNITHSGL